MTDPTAGPLRGIRVFDGLDVLPGAYDVELEGQRIAGTRTL